MGPGTVSAAHDGGPAFPTTMQTALNGEAVTFPAMGMSLRDYLAIHAPLPYHDMTIEDHCAWRYRFADAMLEARCPAPLQTAAARPDAA